MTTEQRHIPCAGGFFTQTTYILANGWRVISSLTGAILIDAGGRVRHIAGRSPLDAAEALKYAEAQP